MFSAKGPLVPEWSVSECVWQVLNQAHLSLEVWESHRFTPDEGYQERSGCWAKGSRQVAKALQQPGAASRQDTKHSWKDELKHSSPEKQLFHRRKQNLKQQVTKKHWIIYFKVVNFVALELHFNKSKHEILIIYVLQSLAQLS